jgi:hypothetical protein
MGQEIVNYDKQWAAQMEQYTSQEQLQGGTFLSTRGGTLAFGEETLPGNQACVIILDAVKENTYYAEKFDADNPAAPICYAYGRGGEDDMAPHESMQVDLSYFQPQSDTCAGCKFNEWGSADKGRGKACQNRRRLALIPAGFYEPKRGSRDFNLEFFTDPKHFQTAEIAFVKLPVLSVKEWSKFVNDVAATFRRPPHGVITRLFLEPDPKAQYKICFEAIEEVSDELAAIIMQRHDAATKAVIQGYRPPEERPVAQNAGSLRGLRPAPRR